MYLKLKVGALMKERGVSERDMHEKTGLARNTVRSLMRGAVSRVDFDSLEKIAAALSVRPMELFEETEEKPGRLVPAGAAV